MSFINMLRDQVREAEAVERRVREAKARTTLESLVPIECEAIIFSERSNMDYLISNSRSFTIPTHFDDTPNIMLTRKFVYSYLRAKELAGRGEIRFEAYFLMVYHDHAFQIQGEPGATEPGNQIVTRSRASFKALLGNMDQAFFNSIHEQMMEVYDGVESFQTPVGARESVRTLLSSEAELSISEFRMFLDLACLLIGRQIKVEVELTFMYLLIALSKGSAVDARFILRKIKSFKQHRAFDTSHVLDDMDPECIVQFTGLLNDMIADEKITIELIVNSLSRSLAKCTNVAVKPMIAHIGFKNITPLLNVLKCLVLNASFPWASILKQAPRLETELNEVKRLVGILRGKPYLTHKLSGSGPAFSMLAYLCTQLLIKTGVDSLEGYRGVGSDEYTSTTPYDKNEIKKYIQAYISDPNRGFNYEQKDT